MYILYWGEFKDCRKFSVNFAKPEVSSFTHAQLTWQQKAQGELVWSGCLYEGRWNERVWAKRCDAVDCGLLKQGDFTYSKEITRNSLLCESATFFLHFWSEPNWEKMKFSGMKTGLWILCCEWVRSSCASCWHKILEFDLWIKLMQDDQKLFSLVSS